MQLALQIFLSCPHVTGYISCTDYLSFEIALSRYFNNTNSSLIIENSCKLAFKNNFYENVNENKYYLLKSLLKPIIGENYKHLWFYINFIQDLINDNDISERLTIFEIYVLL